MYMYIYRLEVSEQALGGIPLGFGIVINLHVCMHILVYLHVHVELFFGD